MQGEVGQIEIARILTQQVAFGENYCQNDQAAD